MKPLLWSNVQCWADLPQALTFSFSEFLVVYVWFTAVQLVFNPFSQLVPQLELYSQLQVSLWSDPIAFSVPRPT